MLHIIEAHPNWPVFEHPAPRLASRRPIWSDMTPVDTTAQWREDWQSASVVNYTTETDATNWQPGFDLPRQSWSLLNRFQTGQGPCHAILHKWGLAKSQTCNCGQQQIMSHAVDTCPLTKFIGGLQLLLFTKLKTTQLSGRSLQRLQHSRNAMNWNSTNIRQYKVTNDHVPTWHSFRCVAHLALLGQ